MTQKTILILGGYGNAGFNIAHLLLKHSEVRLILAGRNRKRAQLVAGELNAVFSDTLSDYRVSGMYLDAASAPENLADGFSKADCVIAASSTARYAENTARAAILAKSDYVDIQYDDAKLKTLERLRPDIEAAGLCFITDAGIHPGLPAALVRYAAGRMDNIYSADIASYLKPDWRKNDFAPDTVTEFVERILTVESSYFENGQWRKAGVWNPARRKDLGHEFGEHDCYPMMLEELRQLPALYPALRDTGFFVTGFNRVTDYLVLPILMLAAKIRGKTPGPLLQNLLLRSLRRFGKPPYGTYLQLEAKGKTGRDHRVVKLGLYHEDAYVFTAIAVTACLLQYLDGSVRRPGLWQAALLAEPERLLADMARLGVKVTEK